jgi:DNA repair photolyase
MEETDKKITSDVASVVKTLKKRTMSGKPVLQRDAKTIVTFNSKAFQEKGLCDGLTVNTGDACVYSCSFCYVGSQMWKLVHEKVGAYNEKHGEKRVFEDFVIRRANPMETLRKQILDKNGRVKERFRNPDDNRVVYSSTLVDVAANLELLRETADWVNFILDNTSWQIRLLTKSSLLNQLIEKKLVPDKTKPGSSWSHHQRLIFGFSTGTLDDGLARAFEQGTALVSRRLRSLRWLQDRGLRTFGMICPSLPQDDYDVFARDMAAALNHVEHVWAEVINVRGKSFERTAAALRKAGKTEDAERLAAVSEGAERKKNWEAYARATFEAHVKALPAGKLRFLQYVDAGDADWWATRRDEGAVLLGKPAERKGLCLDEPSADRRYYR